MHDAAVCAPIRTPVRATGGRILATPARYGLQTMCIGGGQGLAAVFERR
jgi:acetyl-CoA C-acetyltransferase